MIFDCFFGVNTMNVMKFFRKKSKIIIAFTIATFGISIAFSLIVSYASLFFSN